MARRLTQMCCRFAVAAAALGLAARGVCSMDDAALLALRDGFEGRRDAAFEAERGKLLKVPPIQPPLGKGRAPYARAQAAALTDFTFRAYWNNEQLPEATAALQQYVELFLGSRGLRNDRDCFYWSSDLLCRIVEFYGRQGSRAPGRLPAALEAQVLDLMWVYARENSRVADRPAALDLYLNWRWDEHEQRGFPPLLISADATASTTWDVLESENHHLQKFTCLWHFSKLLAAAPQYRDRPYEDGQAAPAHYAAWTAYASEYLAQRARRGLFVEAGNCAYGVHSLKGIYNLYDFGELALQQRAGSFLDLYYALWAQEQLGGVRGGGKSRIYPTGGDRRGDAQVGNFMYFYLGWGEPRPPSGETGTVATSGYRLPLVVMDLALDPAGRGVYEIRNRCPGLAADGQYAPPGYRLRQDEGGLVRYSYCTPEFILGLSLTEARPLEDWTLISSQNTWRGVIFPGHRDARIVPQVRTAAPGGNTYNQQWGVQYLGTQITCHTPRQWASGCSDQLRVWLSSAGLAQRTEDAASGWVFVQAAGAYAAVRPSRGAYHFAPSDDGVKSGEWLVPDDGLAPVIIEIARAAEVRSYGDFQRAVAACRPHWEGQVLTYTGRAGHTFVFPADASARPTIDGAPVNLTPGRVYDSPFVQSDWDSGKVLIQKRPRRLEQQW